LEQVQLDRLVEELEAAFGEELPFSTGDLSVSQVDVLRQVFGEDGYQDYLQDQVNRQIIREYLINAVVLGYLPEYSVTRVAAQVASSDGRAALSLHMLMSSVEQAADLVDPRELEKLEPLLPEGSRPSYIKLIHS
jgi:hypothetical protein